MTRGLPVPIQERFSSKSEAPHPVQRVAAVVNDNIAPDTDLNAAIIQLTQSLGRTPGAPEEQLVSGPTA
jgi:hypothetical protein